MVVIHHVFDLIAPYIVVFTEIALCSQSTEILHACAIKPDINTHVHVYDSAELEIFW